MNGVRKREPHKWSLQLVSVVGAGVTRNTEQNINCYAPRLGNCAQSHRHTYTNSTRGNLAQSNNKGGEQSLSYNTLIVVMFLPVKILEIIY